jgi:4-diphosphocytidyl-2-C-methyl-D-erythritol kinase
MISFPNCKINIGLSVINKRADCYHNIETVFYPVKWCDILEIIESDKYEFSQSGLETGKGKNLCEKAYQLLSKQYMLPQVKINLHKVIPVGAGLGGGSADAAFTILMINDLFDLGLTMPQMKEHALRLGSDCPFFIENKPVIAEERGELMHDIDLKLNDFKMLVLFPGINISTAEAYRLVKPSVKNKKLQDIVELPVDKWKTTVINDFEEGVFSLHPVLRSIKEEMYRSGALYASMTGSGSALFALYSKDIKAEIPLIGKTLFEKFRLPLNAIIHHDFL